MQLAAETSGAIGIAIRRWDRQAKPPTSAIRGAFKLVSISVAPAAEIGKGLARILETKNGEEANVFWRDTAKQILSRMSDYGLGAEATEQEVRTLLHAVLNEMDIRNAATDHRQAR